MIIALGLFYIIGGVIFYYYKTEFEPEAVKDEDNYYRILKSTGYKVFVLIACIVWPICLVSNFIWMIASFFIPMK